jgi:hypothetical protein
VESKKVLLTINPVIYDRLQERMKHGYGSVQEVINEILRRELLRPKKVGRPPKNMEDYFTKR